MVNEEGFYRDSYLLAEATVTIAPGSMDFDVGQETVKLARDYGVSFQAAINSVCDFVDRLIGEQETYEDFLARSGFGLNHVPGRMDPESSPTLAEVNVRRGY